MELKLYINQTVTYNLKGKRIYYAGSNPQSLHVVEHSKTPFPQSRSYPNNPAPIDVTEYVSDLHKLKLTWTSNKNSSGVSVAGASQMQKSASGTLTFEGKAYQWLKMWLIDDVSAPLNSVDVSIQQMDCGTYINYKITAADLQWCEGSICTFDVTVKQKDEALNCIKRTLISHNEYGIFNPLPQGGKKHPRFSYCNEQRPNGILVMVWWMAGVVSVPTLLFMGPVLISFNMAIVAINIIIGTINLLVKLISGHKNKKVNWKTIPTFDFRGMLDAYGALFIEAGGCGREHPAPLIRDYIENVCKYCNIKVDGNSAPIFFAQTMDVETSHGWEYNVFNPHYNACYFHAPAKRGIRRFKSLSALRGLPNNTDYYIDDNSPLLTLDMFLDELKGLYNAEWRVKNNTLYFQRKDFFLQTAPLYDLSENGADRSKLLEGLCFEWNETKYPAYTRGIYTEDAADTCGNEAENQMNGFAEHGSVDENPNFEGVQDKRGGFGASKFRLDGASVDYLYDAMQIVVNGSFLTPFLAGMMFDLVGKHIEEFADYALLLKDENVTQPKVLLWDGNSYENARCIATHTARWLANTSLTPPVVNTRYNDHVEWWVRHAPQTFVRGSGLTLPPNQPGYYLVTDFFGAREIKKPAMLLNYPMYFEPGYEGTLWDWFHWIDDPFHKPVMNMNWQAKIDLCCEDIKKLALLGDLQDIKLGQKVVLPVQYYNEGRITEIEVSYDVTDSTGPYIQLKGTV